MLKPNGYLSFILPDAFLTEKYATKIRAYLLANFRIVRIDFFPQLLIFKGVSVHNIVLTIQKAPPKLPVLKVIHTKDLIDQKVVDQYARVFTNFYDEKLLLDEKKIINLGDICYISKGIVFHAKHPQFKNEFRKRDA